MKIKLMKLCKLNQLISKNLAKSSKVKLNVSSFFTVRRRMEELHFAMITDHNLITLNNGNAMILNK